MAGGASDIATLVMAAAALSAGGIRPAARRLGRGPATVKAALDRFQARLGFTLVRSQHGAQVLTLEGERHFAEIARMAEEADSLAALAGAAADPPAGDGRTRRAARLGVGLEALRRFLAVAELGSIRGGAASLGVGQPQLSRQLATLDRQFAAALLAREPDGVRLTETGARVVAPARRLLEGWFRLAGESRQRQWRLLTTLRLGSVVPLDGHSPLARRLAAVVARWQARHPSRPLWLASTTAEDLMAGLAAGTYDLAILDTPELPHGIAGHAMGHNPLALVAAGPAPDGSAPGGTAALKAWLAARPLALPSPRSGLRQRVTALLGAIFTDSERERLRLVEIDSLPVLLNLVTEQGYASILPAGALPPGQEDLARASLAASYDLPLWLAWRAGATAPEAAAEILASLGEATDAAGPAPPDQADPSSAIWPTAPRAAASRA